MIRLPSWQATLLHVDDTSPDISARGKPRRGARSGGTSMLEQGCSLPALTTNITRAIATSLNSRVKLCSATNCGDADRNGSCPWPSDCPRPMRGQSSRRSPHSGFIGSSETLRGSGHAPAQGVTVQLKRWWANRHYRPELFRDSRILCNDHGQPTQGIGNAVLRGLRYDSVWREPVYIARKPGLGAPDL